MSEQNRPEESQREKTGQTDQEQQDKSTESTEEKSPVDKMIDKAQEKGWTEKAANMVKGKLRGR